MNQKLVSAEDGYNGTENWVYTSNQCHAVAKAETKKEEHDGVSEVVVACARGFETVLSNGAKRV